MTSRMTKYLLGECVEVKSFTKVLPMYMYVGAIWELKRNQNTVNNKECSLNYISITL